MTKILLILSLVFAVAVTSCDKDSSGTINDFSNSVAPYATLDITDSIDVVEGDSASIDFDIRTAFNEPDKTVTLTYDVSGAVTLKDQTAVIQRNETTGTGTFWIPDNLVTSSDPDSFVVANVLLTKAETSDGDTLRLGQKNDPSLQVLKLRIFRPF